jgi:hypothetical protein
VCLPYKTLNFQCSESWIHTKLSTSSTPVHCVIILWPGERKYYWSANGFKKERASCRHWRGNWVDLKAGFQVLYKLKISFLAGKRTAPPVFRFSQQSVALCFTSRRCCPVLQFFQTLSQLGYVRSCYSSDERSRRLAELQRGTGNDHQPLARPCLLQPTRRMQTRRHTALLSLRRSRCQLHCMHLILSSVNTAWWLSIGRNMLVTLKIKNIPLCLTETRQYFFYLLV